ncbi:hypothetical protein VTN77DRAFT_7984 [Rasamsonia byssochlamydoides]|uniref:uncharacterized protein n=1 Tax=Rasamsonia byssochlamydoides TaxID=89139 RepID=UPI0037428E24
MVHSLPLTGFIVIVLVIKWLWKWFSSQAVRSKGDDHDDDVTRMPPYPSEPIKGREKFQITMGLRKLDEWNWLTIDKNYMKEHQVRDALLRDERENVFQCLPESREACAEALEEVTKFLCERFPSMFEKKKRGSETVIHNKKTGETFVFGGKSNTMEPLEIAVRLTMEDLSILMKNDDGEYYLAASASLFPVGWRVQDRIGWTISQLHGPVPQWHEKIGHSVNKFMCRLTPESPMERSNYFLEIRQPGEDLSSTLFRPDGLMEQDVSPLADDILIRRERQTFRRLPRTGALVFSVKTTLTTLSELPLQEVQNLAKEIQNWPEDIAAYKGRDIWGKHVMEYCNQRAGLQITGEGKREL